MGSADSQRTMERIFPGSGAGPPPVEVPTVLRPRLVVAVRPPATFGPPKKEVLASLAQGDFVSSSCRSSSVHSSGFLSFQNSLGANAHAGTQAAAAAPQPHPIAVRRVTCILFIPCVQTDQLSYVLHEPIEPLLRPTEPRQSWSGTPQQLFRTNPIAELRDALVRAEPLSSRQDSGAGGKN